MMLEENLSTQKTAPVLDDVTYLRSEDSSPAKEGVVRIVPSKPNRPSEFPLPNGTAQRRDWASAIELVNEASQAIRLAEEKASAAERYSEELNQYHLEQAKLAEAKINALEKRLNLAESRANEAEEWLRRFHDAIMDGFKGILKQVG
jgi:hypothetical protein